MEAPYVTSSTDLIKRLETSSVGPLQTYFETPSASATVWRTPTDDLNCAFHAQVTSDDFQLSFSTWAGHVDSVKKMLACTILCSFPEPLLDEALRSLRDQFEFYAEDLRCRPPIEEQLIGDGFITRPRDSLSPAFPGA